MPANEPTAPDQISKVKVGATKTEIYQPDEIEKLLNAAAAVVIPYLAIGAFAGLRGGELARLDWNAVNLDRRFIELRADQAKTASRRIVPISDNLAAWLEPLERDGKVLKVKAVPRMASDVIDDFLLEISQRGLSLQGQFLSHVVRSAIEGCDDPTEQGVTGMVPQELLRMAKEWRRDQKKVLPLLEVE